MNMQVSTANYLTYSNAANMRIYVGNALQLQRIKPPVKAARR